MKQSGVRTVIEDIFFSLERFKKINPHLIYSSKKGKFEQNKNIKLIDIPEIDYDEYYAPSKEALMKKARALKDRIKKRLDLTHPCILHCHNVNLMKNSYLGAALGLLAEDLKDKKFALILQQHDFAEENRPAQLKLLLNCSGKKDRLFGSKIAYPINSNIWYLAINSRDMKLIQKIGIPKDRISLYPNSIDTKFFSSKTKNTKILISRLYDYAKTHDYNFKPDKKILLSPLKVIKRKNIIETVLILNILNHVKDEWQLLITLEGSSPIDKEYGNKIKAYIKKHKLPVTIGFGYELISPEEKRNHYQNNMVDLFSISDAIITTSIQEGFGFTYLEGWVAKKKVIGRRLPYIFPDFEANGVKLNHFYSKILINRKDFTKYSVNDKIKLLEKIDYEKLSKQPEIKKMINFLNKNQDMIIKHNKNKIIKNYSRRAYGKKLMEIINRSLSTKKEDWKEPKLDNLPLINYFKRNNHINNK